MNEQAHVYACAAPKDPAPREAHPSLPVGDSALPHSNRPMGSSMWGGAGSRPARYPAPLVPSPAPPPPALGSPAYSRCVVITWAARGARLVLVFPCVCRVSSGELLSFPVSTQACTSADLWAPSARTLTSPAGRRPVMPLVRYRKVAILGYRSVGKTSLAHQFVEGEFLKGYDPTVENTYSKTVTLGKDEFHLHLVDTAGQDKYSILPYSFIIGVHGYVLVYNVTSLRSFQIVKNLYQKLQEGHGKTRLPVLLVGNKADLSADREVQAVEGKKLAESWGATFMESSARDNQVLVIQEIARVENSYGQDRRCCLM
ncbi:GTPase RhebL1 isoform X3 [Rattus norvegicus]|uniref:GTPase RhebL1 isoform X3 n=2 Tax=Rattus norvegicus TaxID=10116 RepID=UPI002FD7E0BD